MLYVTTGGLFPDSFKQKAIACWMGDGRERETSINDKGAAHHGNRHTKKSLLGERGQSDGGGGGAEGDKQRGRTCVLISR